MKHLFSVLVMICVLCFSFETFAQSVDFLWTKQANGTLRDYPYALKFDPQGRLYLTGEFFSPTLTFSPSVFVNRTAAATGNCDFFLAKYDTLGNPTWAKMGGGSLTDRGYGVVVDKFGKVVVTGHYYGTATFDTVTRTSAGNLDCFTAMYDTSGNITWFREGKSVSQVSTRAITTDGLGNTAICGYFGTSTAPTVTFDNVILTTNGQRDIFVVKYNSSGVIQWGKNAGGNQSGEEGKDCAMDSIGNVYVTGIFKDTAYFGSQVLYGNGGYDIFIAKYNPNGDLIWVKKAGGPKDDEGAAIVVDKSGLLFVGGKFDSVAVFGTSTVFNNGKTDAFFAAMDTAGNFISVRIGGGTDNDALSDLAVDNKGNIYGIGSFRGTATFQTFPLTSRGEDDVFLFKMDYGVTQGWVKQGGGTDVDKGITIDVDYKGNVIGAGSFRLQAFFGLDTLTSLGVEDIFVTKITGYVVPVELTSFSASRNGNIVNLKWITATETNNSGFAIERKIADSWNELGFVNGFGSTTEPTYYFYNDNISNINYSGKVAYRLKQVDFDGTYKYSNEIEIDLNPDRFILEQNYPNPFNPSTNIRFEIGSKEFVTLKIYDVLGNEVTTLVNDVKEAGSYNVEFSASGLNLSSGTYFYRLNAGKFSQTYKMILIK